MADRLLQDLRYALRQIRRAPGFAASVIVTLALAIGANAALFSLVNALILRPLPVHDPERLILLQARDARNAANRPIYYTAYAELAQLPVFERLALYSGGGGFFIEAGGRRVQGTIEASTPGLFETLGLTPHLGRFFTTVDSPADARGAMVAVLSHDIWMRLFDGDPSSIGQTILIDGQPFTLIGVTPPSYKGLYADGGMGFSIPLSVLNRQLSSTTANRPVRGLNAVARLAPGVSVDHARAAIDAAWPSIRATTVPAGVSEAEQRELPTQLLRVSSFATGFSGIRDRYEQPLLALGAVTLVLLALGCVNLSGLLLARTAARERQFVVIVALGASRARVVRQLVLECLVLSGIAAVLALPLAWGITSAAAGVLWQSRTPLARSLAPDATVLAVTALVTIVIGMLLSLLPAWSAGRSRPQSSIGGDRTVVSSSSRWGKGLLVAQIAMSLVLLVGAGLFTASLARLRNIDSGLHASNVRWARLFGLPNVYRNQDDATYYPELYRRLSEVPGIQSMAFAALFPAYFNVPQFLQTQRVAPIESASDVEAADSLVEFLTPNFFTTVGIPLLGGRDFSWSDEGARPAVAIVNNSLARRLFPNGNAIGRHIRIGSDPRRQVVEIVGVAADAAIGDYKAPHQPVVFRPRMQELPLKAPVLVFRSSEPAASIDAAIAAVIADLGHEYPNGFYGLTQQVDIALTQERILAVLSACIAALAVLLASVGIYSLLSYAVSRRTREIGVRMALGASQAGVSRMILRDAMRLTMAGLALGVPAALAAGAVLRSLLFGSTGADPAVLAGAAVLFAAIAALAGLRPARRASRVDPMVALRAE